LLKLKKGDFKIKVFLKINKSYFKIIKNVKTQKGEIFVKVFLKIKKRKLIKVILKIIKIVKT
jgi:hypothetical protein